MKVNSTKLMIFGLMLVLLGVTTPSWRVFQDISTIAGIAMVIIGFGMKDK